MPDDLKRHDLKNDDLNPIPAHTGASGRPAPNSVVGGTGGPDQADTAAVRSLEDEQDRDTLRSEDDELNEALEESFPASDPVSQISRTTSTQRDADAKDK
jgi:hypothetical protein